MTETAVILLLGAYFIRFDILIARDAVDGLPGSSPPSIRAAAPSRMSSGTSSSRFGSGPPG